jgi:DNA-binding transcriptional ArsR family regulator
MCFLPTGALVDEFSQIFSEIFEESAAVKKNILRVLAHGSMTGSEIAESLSVDRNGHLTRHLDELDAAGFVSRDGGLNPETGKPAKIVQYRIRDNYTRFYLHHMEPRIAAIKSGSFAFETLDGLSGWQGILGLQFEALVVNHYKELLPMLNPGGNLILSAAPYCKRGKNGVQVDLLLQMRNAMELVEVKRAAHIDESVEEDMERKVSRMPVIGRKSVRTALVYDGMLSPSIRENGYFDVLVSAKEWLGIM